MLQIVGVGIVLWGLGGSVICGYIGRSIAERAGVNPNAGLALGMTLGPAGVAVLSWAIRRGSVRGRPYRVS
jgi:hypothetical protein